MIFQQFLNVSAIYLIGLRISASFFQIRLEYIKYTEHYHEADVSGPDDLKFVTYAFRGANDIKEGFDDKMLGNSDHVDIFSVFMMNDDKTLRKNAHGVCCRGFRIVVPTSFSVSLIQQFFSSSAIPCN